MTFLKKHLVSSIFANKVQKLQTKDQGIQKKCSLEQKLSRISQLNYSGSFPELVPLELQLGVPASKS